MNKFGFGTIAASGLVAAILGLSAPAQAAVSAGDTPTALASVTDTPTGIDHHTCSMTSARMSTSRMSTPACTKARRSTSACTKAVEPQLHLDTVVLIGALSNEHRDGR